MKQPNILYIHSHDTGRYIEPYGFPVATPNLRKLAEEGVLFRKAFAACPTCSPSRGALLTGMYPHSNGLTGLVHRGFRLNDSSRHLARYLREQGYVAALAGVQHEAPREEMEATVYEKILCPRGPAADVAEAAAGFLKSAPKRPFFLSVGFFETHRVFPQRPADSDPGHTQPPPGFPDTPEIREDMAAFLGSVRLLDRSIGMVLAALDEAGLAGETLVVATTDHGIPFPLMKCNVTDGGIGVSLIMRGPDGFSGGKVVDSLVSQVDLFPTLCECGDLPRPDWLQGVSLLPMIRGEIPSVRDRIFAEVNFHVAYDPQRCVRTERWKYVRRFEESRGTPPSNIDAGPGKDFFLRAGLGERENPLEALYDVYFDPGETNNRITDPACAEVLVDLRESLERWMEESGDPIRYGPMRPPPGAVLETKE